MAYTKPVPQWYAQGAEPPESLKQSGFAAGYKPPADYFNWFWYSVSQCLTELQNGGMTADEIAQIIAGYLKDYALANLSNVTNTNFKLKAIEAGVGGIPVIAATSTDGVAYTATATGITELSDGLEVIIIPNKLSTNVQCTFNLNELGAKNMRYMLAYNTGNSGALPPLAGWLGADVPVKLRYSAKYNHWFAEIQRQSTNSLYGTVSIESGGTGADNAADARTNLGVPSTSDLNNYVPKSGTTMTGGLVAHTGTDYTTFRMRNIAANTTAYTAGTTALANGYIYLRYE